MERYADLPNVYHRPAMAGRHRVFRNRGHAGNILADMLAEFSVPPSLVLGIPAGGVPVASVIAERMGLALDLAVVSKITLPWDTEAGYGAVAFNGTTRINRGLADRLRLDETTISKGIGETTEKVNRRSSALRGKRPFPDLSGKSILLVDDGLASGFTMRVAVEALSKRPVSEIWVAVPTGQLRSIEHLSKHVHIIICPNIRSSMVFAVADAYEHWSDVPESEVLAIMEEENRG